MAFNLASFSCTIPYDGEQDPEGENGTTHVFNAGRDGRLSPDGIERRRCTRGHQILRYLSGALSIQWRCGELLLPSRLPHAGVSRAAISYRAQKAGNDRTQNGEHDHIQNADHSRARKDGWQRRSVKPARIELKRRL